MRLSSQNSQFIFNLPQDFLPQEWIIKYKPILEKNWIQYENVVDYLNSTIKSVQIPGLSVETPKQVLVRGKERNYKPATNVQDIVSSREISVAFRSVDSDLNYWLLYDIFIKHYVDVDNLFVKPFMVTAVDIWRDAIYRLKFYELIATGFSDNKFDYSDQKTNTKEFTLTFKFNFYDIEFLLDQSKILEIGTMPKIIQKD
jgi:hypothetical protein